ncbi:DUF2911 domain-containing protein [Limnovirga soli]|uniref:DUF2911 domain-containing protein n=1 Tax=Limnovirga soli TaxID=2656915 RepID=A0A8J8JSS6_9BACT|nr:DUF2911 domain-containing protein [Limnovirga soli]NNV57317.1 DUF2911 domain-containing protein [Limnovirga soli]
MKKVFMLTAFTAVLFSTFSACAQDDKSKRPSPPAIATQTIASGATITINYSQPALKGRVIGKDIEPKDGQIWRAGANEATVFEVNKAIMVEGKALPAGKYAFFTIANGNEWTLIFNKTWDTWGAYDYDKNKANDALQVKVKAGTSATSVERLTYTISKAGKVSLNWATLQVDFNVK